jgi:hypothetical protein
MSMSNSKRKMDRLSGPSNYGLRSVDGGIASCSTCEDTVLLFHHWGGDNHYEVCGVARP